MEAFPEDRGFIAVTEVSWFTEERPSEINDFWLDAYPEIDTIPRKVAQMQQTGYLPVATFVLPENCWTEHFYAPQAIAQENFLKKYAGNSTVESLIASQRHEAQLLISTRLIMVMCFTSERNFNLLSNHG